MIAEIFIDYIQYSIDVPQFDGEAIEVHPVKNYRKGYQTESGMRFYTGNALTDKTLVVLSGEVMRYSRHVGATDTQALEWIIDAGGKVSRLDMALDIYVGDTFITPSQILDLSGEGKVKRPDDTVVPYVYGVQDERGIYVQTVYFGERAGRGKAGVVRCYDKGEESEIGRELITRIEVERRKEKAHIAATRCIDYGIAPTMKAIFDVEHDCYQRAIGEGVAPTHRGAQKKTIQMIIPIAGFGYCRHVLPAWGER